MLKQILALQLSKVNYEKAWAVQQDCLTREL